MSRHPSMLSATLVAAMAAVALTACGALAGAPGDTPGSSGGSSVTTGAGPLVVATTTILGDVVGEVIGGDGRVEVLMSPGQDPHGFSPSAQQAELLRGADLVVANGLGLEAAAMDVIEAAEQDGVPVVRVAEEVDPLGTGESADEHAEHAGGDEHDEEEDHAEAGHHHDDGDPHIWFDPLRMADGARVIGQALGELDATGDWDARAERVAASLEATHDEVVDILAAVPPGCRTLVSNHDNLSYLAARYDFEVIGTVLPGTSTAAEPSAQEFARLAEVLRETGTPAIFVETTQTTRLAESLAAEVGRDVAVVELFTDALGEPGSGADTYAGLLTTDARRIADALADC